MGKEYDEALFRQKVKQAARDGRVKASDIEKAFWAVAWDLHVAIEEQRPDQIENARRVFRDTMLRVFCDMIHNELGLIVDYDVEIG